MKKFRVGITGASGILGKKVFEYFIVKGAEISVLTREKKKINNHTQVKIYEIDLNTPDLVKIKDFVKNLDLLFHLASELRDESKMMAVNYGGTKILADMLLGKKTHLIYTSSIGVFDFSKSKIIKENSTKNEINLYEKTKLLSEDYLFKLRQGGKLNFIILRPSIILDLEMKSKIIDNFVFLNYFKIGLNIPKSVVLNFIQSRDVVSALIKLSLQKKAVGKAFNLSTDVSLKLFALEIEKIIGGKVYYRIPHKLLLMSLKLFILITGKRKFISLKSFFSSFSKVSSEKIQDSIDIKIDDNYSEFLKSYIELKR